jgi:hypothetical protein
MLTYSSCQQESGTVCCGVVCQADFDAIVRQLVTVGGSDHAISLESGVDDLRIEK